MQSQHIRFVMSSNEHAAPFTIESIGFNPEQEPVIRPDGYECYHWLQTVKGQGIIEIDGAEFVLPNNHGCLLLPNIPHHYAKDGDEWQTVYVTFEGPQAMQVVSMLGLHPSSVYHWTAESPLRTAIVDLLDNVMHRFDVTGLDHSVDLYRFLVLLKKQAITDRYPSMQSLIDRLRPLLNELDRRYADPDLGMTDMADAVGISFRRLSSLFKQAFSLTPYQYLIHLRMRKAKELLLDDRSLAVKDVGTACGFRDASHFVATFHKLEGVTPDRYRSRYSLE